MVPDALARVALGSGSSSPAGPESAFVMVGDRHSTDRLLRALPNARHVEETEAALDALSGVRSAVLCIVGESASEAARVIASCVDGCAGRIICVVTDGGSDLSALRDLMEADCLFYAASGPLSEEALSAILHAAHRELFADGTNVAPLDPWDGLAMADLADRLSMQTEPTEAVRLAVECVRRVASPDRAYCFLYDRVNGVLELASESQGAPPQSAATGLAGFAARTGYAVHAASAHEDPRFDRAVDDPSGSVSGSVSGSILIEPVVDSEGEVRAVLALVWESEEALPAAIGGSLRWTALQLAAALSRTALHSVSVSDERQASAGPDDSVFRAEAVRHHGATYRDASPLRLTPTWVRPTYWLLAAMCLSALVLGVVAQVHDYESGPAVVRVDSTGRGGLVALLPGHARPEVDVGDTLRLSLAGYPNVRELALITMVGDRVLDASSASEAVGLHSVLPSPGVGVFVVHASLTRMYFSDGTRELHYFDGMVGEVDVRLASQPLLRVLVPAMASRPR